MLRQILCLPSINPAAVLAGLAAASQAAVCNSNGSVQRLYRKHSGNQASQAADKSSSSASSALHHVQRNPHQPYIPGPAPSDQHWQQQQRISESSTRQQRSSCATSATAAASPASRAFLQLQQQQQALCCQHTRQRGWNTPCLHHQHHQHHQQQQQRQLLQGAAAFWLGGQAWRGLRIHSSDKPLPKGKRSPMQPKPKPAAQGRQMRRNTQITAAVVMVVMPDGSKQEMVLSAALEAAAGLGLDLVEVNPRGQPPVTRVMDWGKLAYEQQKKAEQVDKLRRKDQKLLTPREMQFSARIADHDLEVKMRKVAGWLDKGYRVQLVVKHGREESAAAAEALDYLLARVQADYNVEAGAQQQQRRAVSLLVKPLGAPGEAAKNKATEAAS